MKTTRNRTRTVLTRAAVAKTSGKRLLTSLSVLALGMLFAGRTEAGIIAHWKFDEASGQVAVDSAGTSNGHVGETASVDSADPTIDQAGKFGRAYDFYGATAPGKDRVNLKANLSNFSGLTGGTIAGWFKTADTTRGALLKYGEHSGHDRLILEMTGDGKLRFIVREDGTNDIELLTTAAFEDDAWHHVAVTQNGTSATLLVDGTPATLTTTNNGGEWFDDVTGAVDMYIGIDVRGGQGYGFSGLLDDFAVYDEALSASQRNNVINLGAENFNGGGGGGGTPVVLPAIANPDFETDANLFTAFPGRVGGSNPAEITSWPGTGNSRGINPGDGAGAPFRNNGNNTSNVAFMQNVGSISNTISGFEVGEEYRIAFDYNSRSGYAVPGMAATIGSASLTDASVPAVGGSNSYYAGNLVFTAANATETLTISQTVGGDRTLLVDNFRVFRNGPAIADNGFENPVQPGNTWKLANGSGSGDLTGSAWTITGPAGITRNVSANQNGIRAPQGDQHALLKVSSSFVQTINGFEVGAEYSLSLLAMARQGQKYGNDLEVVLDDGLASEIMLIDIPEVTFSSFTELESLAFLAEKDSYELTIRSTLDGGALSGDRTTAFDNLWFNQLTEPGVIPEPATMALLGLALAGLGGYVRRRRKLA